MTPRRDWLYGRRYQFTNSSISWKATSNGKIPIPGNFNAITDLLLKIDSRDYFLRHMTIQFQDFEYLFPTLDLQPSHFSQEILFLTNQIWFLLGKARVWMRNGQTLDWNSLGLVQARKKSDWDKVEANYLSCTNHAPILVHSRFGKLPSCRIRLTRCSRVLRGHSLVEASTWIALLVHLRCIELRKMLSISM